MARLLLAAVLLPLALPGTALAATVSVRESEDEYVGQYLDFAAAQGETNQVTISFAAGQYSVRDASSPLTAGAGCSALDAHSATCATGPYVQAELGDGNDSIAIDLSSTEGFVSVDGGPGNDVLDASRVDAVGPRGSPGDTLDGGPGDDRLQGGPNADSMFGGEGSDVLRAGRGFDVLSGDGPERVDSPESDLLDGGAGADTATYEERARPLVVDLHRGRGGERGEGDRLRRIEDVVGGSAADVLRGDDGRNALSAWSGGATGGAGGDVLVGRGGADELAGTPRGAVFDGGSGDDLLHTLSRRDALHCGPGQDTLRELRDGALVPSGCEWIDLQVHLVSRGTVRAGHAVFQVRRPRGRGARCAGSLALRSPGGASYGHVRWGAAGPRNPRLSLALTPAGRAAALLHRVAVVRAFERCADTANSWRLRL